MRDPHLGTWMNWNFMMAGSASSNPVLFSIAIGLILAWKIAGLVGADRLLLPWLGTPWSRTAPRTAVRGIVSIQVPASGD